MGNTLSFVRRLAPNGNPCASRTNSTSTHHHEDVENIPLNDRRDSGIRAVIGDEIMRCSVVWNKKIMEPQVFNHLPEILQNWLLTLQNSAEEMANNVFSTPLHYALENIRELSLSPEATRLLAGATETSLLHFTSQQGQSYIHLAAINLQSKTLKFLVAEFRRESKIVPTQDNCCRTALHYLAAMGVPFADRRDRKNVSRCINILLSKHEAELQHTAWGFMGADIDGKTPVHHALDQRNYSLARRLLHFYSKKNEEKESTTRNSKAPEKEWKPIVHYICTLKDDSKDIVNLLKKLLKDKKYGNGMATRIWNMYAPLHLAVMFERTKIIELLVEVAGRFAMDSQDLTPLHHAVVDGVKENASKIIDQLLEKGTLQIEDKLSVLGYVAKDAAVKGVEDSKVKPSVFEVSVDNCYQKTTLQILGYSVPRLEEIEGLGEGNKRMDAELFLENCSKGYTIILHHMLQTCFLHGSVTVGVKKELYIDLRRITGLYGKNHEAESNHQVSGFTPEIEKLRDLVHRQPFKEMEAVLLHPVVQYIVFRKLERILPFMRFFLIVQVLWFFAMTIYADQLLHSNTTTVGYISCGCVLFYTLSSMAYELREMCLTCCSENLNFRNFWKCFDLVYIGQWSNLGQLTRNCLLIISTVKFLLHDMPTARTTASVGIILAFPLMMRHFRHMWKVVGQTIDILGQVLKIICKALASCVGILWGFSLAMRLLFQDIPNNSVVIESMNETLPSPFYKILVMMTGEFEYNFGNALESSSPNFVYKNVVFLSFLVAIVFAYFNQLTGVALSKVQEMQRHADVQRIVSKIEYIFFVETLMKTTKWKGLVTRFSLNYDKPKSDPIHQIRDAKPSSNCIKVKREKWSAPEKFFSIDICRPPNKDVFDRIYALAEASVSKKHLTKYVVLCHPTCMYCNDETYKK